MVKYLVKKPQKDFLKRLLSAPGASSFESRPASAWREQAQSYGAGVRADAYGNTFATFNEGGKPRVMLAGHIDEIGLIITYVDDNGLLYFQGRRRLGPAAAHRAARAGGGLQGRAGGRDRQEAHPFNDARGA